MLAAWHFPVLFGTGLVAGFVDSIAGGGGLITIPVLLSSGLDPQQALGTNKLQASFGSGSASWHYARAGAVDVRDCVRGFALAMTGAAVGAVFVQRVAPQFLKRFIPLLLIAIAFYMLLRPRLGHRPRPQVMPRLGFDLLFGLGIGFYDGFFGPGTGTFWAMAYVTCLGFDLTRATGYTKVMNFASNLSSLAFFLWGGNVLFGAGLVMGAGQLVGARLGAGVVIKRGTQLIRPVFISVVVLLALKLLYEVYAK